MTNRSTQARRPLAGIIAVVAMLLIMGIGATLAFTTRTRTVDSTLAFGSVATRMIQTTLDGQGDEQPVDETVPETLHGGTASRITRVRNTGSQPVWVRVRPQATGDAADGGTVTLTSDDYVCPMGEGWTDGHDGWWYYETALDADETTTPATTTIRFTNEGMSKTGGHIRFDVESQAVQTANNADTALDARGWPETEEKQ